jgi:5'-methylthioadenosine phosphorylase
MIYKDIPKVQYAVIGGSGTWACEFPEDIGLDKVTVLKRDMEFETPFGTTMPFKLCRIDCSMTIDGKERIFLTVPFHGWHGLEPYNTPSEQVFWVFKQAGVKNIIVEGSGGGVNHLLDPGDIIIPTDFIDFTKRRSHISAFTNKILRMKDPLCPALHSILYKNAKEEYKRVFQRGVYATSEAPRFESATEIQFYNHAGADIVGHTMIPEVYLSRAIGACYAGLYIVSNHAEGLVTNWKGSSIFDWYRECALPIGRIMIKSIAQIPAEKNCECLSYRTDVPDRITNRIKNN